MKRYRAYLQLTKACNLKCKMCDFWKNEKEVFDRSHFFNLIDILVNDGIKVVCFWGGEPFLYPEIYDLIKYSKEKGLVTEIITNGTVIDNKKIGNVIEYLDEIFFSIDSGTPEIHNKIRGRDFVFKKAISNLEHIVELKKTKKKNMQITIDTTLQKDNFETFDSILSLAKKYGVKINFDPVQIFGYGNHREKSKLLLNEDEAFDFEERLMKIYMENMHYIIQSKESIKMIIRYFKGYKIERYCKSLNKDILIDPYGNVLKCWGNGEILYNIIETGKIDETRLRMDQGCYSCAFTHVREGDYYSGYLAGDDVFEGNMF